MSDNNEIKETGGGEEKKKKEWLAESRSFTAWKPLCSVMLAVPLWNLPEETGRELGEWGCYGN